LSDTDCNDGDSCTEDICFENLCNHDTRPECVEPEITVQVEEFLSGPNADAFPAVSTSGFLSGGQLSYLWCKTAGPGEVEFDPAAAEPVFRFDMTGDYEFEVTATDGQETASTTVNVNVEPTVERPLDSDVFLTRPAGPDEPSIDMADAYYAAIDPFNERNTLAKFNAKNGIDENTPAVAILGDSLTGCCAAATFLNGADLGFGRRMVMAKNGEEVVISVANYASVRDAIDDVDPIATVSMEYSPGPDGGDPFTKFYVFRHWDGSGGSRVGNVDLDGRGAKFVPNLCITCHGGQPQPIINGVYSNGGDVQANFLPFDMSGFEYDCEDGFRESQMEAEFKQLNQGVLATNPRPTIRSLVEGWYDGPGLPSATQNQSFVPSGWADKPDLYLGVVAPSCRICHTSQLNDTLNFDAQEDFDVLRGSIESAIFSSGSMPHALRTYDHFWGSTSPHQPDLLQAYLDSFPTLIVNPEEPVVSEGDNTTVVVMANVPGPVVVMVEKVSGDPDITIASGQTLFLPPGGIIPAPLVFAAANDTDAEDGTAQFRLSVPDSNFAPVLITVTESDAGQSIVFVDDSAPSGGDGTDWDTAFDDLQAALDLANASAAVTEVWVARGTYTPSREKSPGNPASAAFELVDGVAIFGGFVGNETSLDSRVLPTGSDEKSQLNGLLPNGSHVNHVVTAFDVDGSAGTILDGFVIEEGNASGFSAVDQRGGGLHIEGGSPVIRNCVVQQNSASKGGGVAIVSSSPTFDRCEFSFNSTFSEQSSAAAYGGAFYSENSTPVVTHCLFTRNIANTIGEDGGDADSRGGAVFTTGGHVRLINCTFYDNLVIAQAEEGFNTFAFGDVTGHGGAVYADGGLDVLSSTFTENEVFTASDTEYENALGSAVFGTPSSDVLVVNSILWGNFVPAATALLGAVDVTFSCIEGGLPGNGNISNNPMLILGQDVRIEAESPCVNTGDDDALPAGLETDIVGNPRRNGVVDMGSYEVPGNIQRFVLNATTVNVTEGGSANMTVSLLTQPASDVTAQVQVVQQSNASIVVTTGATLTFTAANFQNLNVTVQAQSDSNATNGSAMLQISAPGLEIESEAVQVVENDISPTGQQLFAANCMSCHSPASKAGSSASTITNEINTNVSMMNIQLTPEEIQAIAEFLASQ
jgi:hypothetical protein